MVEVGVVSRVPQFSTREDYLAWKRGQQNPSGPPDVASLQLTPRRSSSLRRIVPAAALLLICAAGLSISWFYLTPHLAISGLRNAILSGDSLALEDRVDFPALRQSLKDQINVLVLKRAANDLKDNPFGALAMGLVTKFTENAIDSFVTPAGLAALALGEKPKGGTDSSPDNKNSEPRAALFEKARITHDSLSRFSAWVPNDKGEEVRFVFARRKLSWKLTGILLPSES